MRDLIKKIILATFVAVPVFIPAGHVMAGDQVDQTFTSTKTVTTNTAATGFGSASCPNGSNNVKTSIMISADGTATSSASSTISQADADQKAMNLADAKAQSIAKANAQSQANSQAQSNANQQLLGQCNASQVVTAGSTTTTPPADTSKDSTALPNTGSGALAVFTGVGALAGIGHFIWNRRLNKL